MSATNIFEPPQKKARRTFPLPTATKTSYSEAVLSSREAFDLHKRSEAFSDKIHAFYEEFPEMERIIPLEDVQKESADAVKFYKEEIEAKERYHINEMNSPLYALPDEVLQKCIAFIGEGHYALVATVSKKVYNAHEEEYGIDKSYTTYDIATVSVETAKCCNEEFCNSLAEKDRLFTAAAVHGNIDILRYSVESGYDLFPFIHVHDDSDCIDSDESSNRSWDGYNDDDEEDEIVDTGKITRRDNLHVLKYLKDQFESYKWLQKYCQSAIEHGQLEILKWLHSIGCLHEIDIFGTNNDFCLCAISSGQLDVLKWLHGLGFEECEKYIHYAIESKSMEMIEYCLDMLGHFDLNNDETNKALAKAKSIELYHFFHGLGHRLTMDAINDLTYTDKEILSTNEDFEIIKFLRSVGVAWNRYFMTDIVSRGSFEMIKFAHEDGCPWCVLDFSEIYDLLSSGKEKYCSQKLKYLVDNGCPFDHDGSKRASLTLKACCELRELSALECLVGKYSRFDNALLKELLSKYKSHDTYGPFKDKPWLEGIKFVFEKGKEISCFDTIEGVFDVLPNMELVKHLRERLKLPWTSNDLNKYILLSKIACHHGIEGVQWALDNGLGYDNPSLKCCNNISYDTYDVCKLIVERGFVFPSSLEKREIIEHAFMECCKHPNDENRKSLALLRKIPVCALYA